MALPPSSTPPQSTPPPGSKEEKPMRPTVSKDTLLDYLKNHTRETVAYVLLIVGIILMALNESIYGGMLVGLVTGIYFGDDIVNYIKQWKMSSPNQSQDLAKHIISLGIAIAFFIVAPAIYLGAAVSIGIKQLFINQGNTK